MERSQALALLQKYNQEPFHIMHALTVEGVMRRNPGWDLNDLFEKTILAMRSCEDGVRKECLDLTGVEE